MCRTRSVSCTFITAIVLQLIGCFEDFYPDKIPSEILMVQANSQRFSEMDHALADVSPGTVMDRLDGLVGCWGRVTAESGVYTDTGETYVQHKIQSLRFSAAPGRLMAYELLSFPAGSREEEVYGGPFLFAYVEDYRILDGNTIEEKIIEGKAGQVREDGTIGFSLFTLSAMLSNGNAWESTVTLKGDLLRLDVASWAPAASASGETGVSLWRRLDCSD